MATTVYHLTSTSDVIAGATVALLPGDPGRVEALARSAPLTGARELANKREFRTWMALRRRRPGPGDVHRALAGRRRRSRSTNWRSSGVRTFLRVGTTGAIQPDVDVGTVIVTTGAVRLDGASTHYAPIEYPAVAHPDVVAAAIARRPGAGRPVPGRA